MFAQQKLLEEPCGVSAVPFCGARIRHGLDELVFRAQGRRASFGLVADHEIRIHQILGEGARIGEM
jgi:hypothetical protein